MYPIQTLQPQHLDLLIKHQKPVTLYFKNGHKITGTVMGMTDEVIFQTGHYKIFLQKIYPCCCPNY